MGWRAVWKHQLRWARTIRVCQPVPYFFSILSNATLWPLLWLAAAPTRFVFAVIVGSLVLRIGVAMDLHRRLTQVRPSLSDAWFVLLKDILQFGIWLLAFFGNRVEWRGERFRLRRDGTLARN
jgi:ceramide glucosyltransferase